MSNSTNKVILLTGATGFTGSYVLKKLVAAGWKIHLLVRSESFNKLPHSYDNVVFHIYDGSIASISKVFSLSSPECVVHMASLIVGEHTRDMIDDLIESNIMFGTQLLEVMVEKDVRNFINTGTYWEHYEGAEYSPVGLYAATKYAFQNILQYYVEAKGIRAITLKLFDGYGPNDLRGKLMTFLLKAITTGKALDLSPGKQQIDLVYIDDVVEAFIIAIERLGRSKVEGHDVYGVCTKSLYTLQEVVGIVEKIIGKKANVSWGGRAYRDREVMLPAQHLPILPGWEAKVSLEQGVKNILLLNEN